MTCPLCRARKARRACPALRADICPVCCGTKRLVEIACPSTCVYLESAQRHPAAAVKRQQQRDAATVLSFLGPLTERQLQLFLLVQTFISRFTPPDGAALADADVAAAAGAVAATMETAGRGVLYEHQAPSRTGESLRRELAAFLAKVGGSVGSTFERDAVPVLRGIERGARHEGLSESGPQAYMMLVARMLNEPPPAVASGTSIIIP